ncbi:MAG: methylmalonyl-CoA epimerase [Nitrososphaerales archaeon]|nr:methylmalonyl-CoA epimerase [Nitrososphaerales archaeon]
MKLDHIGIAVKSLETTLAVYKKMMPVEEKRTEVESQKVRLALVPVGEIYLELLEPLNEESTIAKFISERGEGLHHIAFEVEDIEASMAEFKAKGFHFLYEKPAAGKFGSKVNFMHPKDTGRVLIELTQH